ncbi:MAG: TonB-dependent receptor [Rikenellaceae bacterium]
MRKFTFITMLLAFMVQATIGATNAEFYVRGHVIDAETNEHISHATVAIVGSTIGTVSDDSGHFFLNGIPTGKHTLQVSMVGYSAQNRKIEVKSDSENLDITFELREDVMSLDQVVVSANRSEITRRKSPTIVSIVPTEMFANVGAPTLVDGLSYIPGVRVEDNCQNCGFTQVRINGLDGHYSQILIDSRPMFSALTGVYGLEQIPANMIERVEVIRGGGSALFGSSAIGGTINVITKTPEYNSAEISHTINIIEKGSLDNNTTANVSLVSDNQRAGVTMFGQIRNRDSYDANGDGFTEIAELESSTIGLRTFFKTSDYSKLSLSYDYSSEYRRGGNNLDLPAHEEAVDIAEMVEHKINGAGVNYDIFSKNYSRKLNLFTTMQKTNRQSYYGGGGLPAYGETDEWISVTGAQFTQAWDKLWFMPAEFVAGLEYNYNDLNDRIISSDSEQEPILQTTHTTSVYLQNEWRNDKLGFLVGVRADKHSLLDKMVFSPRVNFRYNPSEAVNFRATYSTGFRAPQVFDEDLHITMVGGDRTVILLADDLEQEKSRSLSLSADLYKNIGKWSTNLLVEGFYTTIKDAFAVNDDTGLVTDNGDVIWERYNSSGVTVKGLSLEARATLPRVVALQGALTYQKSRYEEAEEFAGGETKEVFRSPDLYGYVTANFDLTRKLQLSASGTYTGSMLVPHAAGWIEEDSWTETEGFFDANIKFSYKFSVAQAGLLELSAGVLNVFNQYQSDFDQGADRDAGYVYGPMSPRRFTFGATLSF